MSGLSQPPVSQPVALSVTAAAQPSTAAGKLHAPAILFFTGLSGAGKSTLATAVESRLRGVTRLVTVIDGDKLRAGLCRDLGFSEKDRHENLRRATELALHLADVGAIVIVALIAPFRSDRALAAQRAAARKIPFAEIFINAPLSVCEQRDPKSLYRRARAGDLPAFTGIDSPYEAPTAPALELHTDEETVEACAERLTRFAINLTSLPASNGAPGAKV